MPIVQKRLFTRAFVVYLVIVFAIAGLYLWASYNASKNFVIGEASFTLIQYPEATETDVRTYVFRGNPETEGVMLTIHETKGAFGSPGRKGYEAFSDHEIILQMSDGVQRRYTYKPMSGNEWAMYGNRGYERFPRFQITMPDGTIEEYSYKNYDAWFLSRQVTSEVRFLLETIIAIKNFIPFPKKLPVTFTCATAAVLFWIGAKILVSNLLILTDPKRRFYGYSAVTGPQETFRYIDKRIDDFDE